MNWIEFLLKDIVPMFIGLVGGGAGIYYWSENKQQKKAEASKSTTEARVAEADFAEMMLQKYEKSVLERMDSGDAVRKKEFQDLKADIGSQLTDIQVENRSQNETIAAQNDLLQDIKEYLNGGFAEFENRKHGTAKKSKKK